jgi:hypothetical protein
MTSENIYLHYNGVIKQYDKKDTGKNTENALRFGLLYVHKLRSYNNTSWCGGKFQQDKMFGNVDCLTRSKRFTNLLPHTDTYTSHMPSSHKTVLIHVLFKFSVCSNTNEVANQIYTDTMPKSNSHLNRLTV